jgi:hypothetical protein
MSTSDRGLCYAICYSNLCSVGRKVQGLENRSLLDFLRGPNAVTKLDKQLFTFKVKETQNSRTSQNVRKHSSAFII